MTGREQCGHVTRYGPCNMEAGHRGRHTTQAWTCNGCGKRRRGRPTAFDPEGDAYCFMCAPTGGRRYDELRTIEYAQYAEEEAR
jgi:hypothetical protein